MLAVEARAVDLTWVDTNAIGIYDTGAAPGGVWDVNGSGGGGIPNATDNVNFGLDQAAQIFLGGPSLSNEVNFTDGQWTLTGGAGAGLTSSGNATIDGVGAPVVTLTNAVDWLNNAGGTEMHVGDIDDGELHLTNGSVVTFTGLRIGNQAGSSGIVTVDGAGSFLGDTASPDFIQVGAGGDGELHVSNDGDVRAEEMLIAVQTGTNATVTIDGAGSSITSGTAASNNRLSIARDGTATVTITNGGSLSNVATLDETNIGENDDSFGTLDVTDGTFFSERTVRLGRNGSNSRGVVLLDNSSFTVGVLSQTLDDLYVGDAGWGAFTASNGTTVEIEDDIFVGGQPGNTNDNKLTLTGVGTTGQYDAISVGSGGKGTLEILDGAVFTGAGLGLIGNGVGSEGSATVGGRASTWNLANDLLVGNNGGGDLSVTGGANVTVTGASELVIGVNSNSPLGSVIVSGVDNNGTAGDTGDDLRSTIDMPNTTGADMTIGGRTGNTGGAGEMRVLDGAYVESQLNTYIGHNATGHGRLVISGVHDPGTPGDGGDDYRSTFDNMDNTPGVGTANDITNIGDVGFARVEVLDGGLFDTERGIVNSTPADYTLFGEAEAFTETVLVSGVYDPGTPGDAGDDIPSTWLVDDGIIIGNTRPGSMRIADGGRVISNDVGGDDIARIGSGGGADGSFVVITGEGSNWTHTGSDFAVGYTAGTMADPVTLDVEDQGTLNVNRILIGDATGSYGIVTVDGTGSRIDANTDVFVGDNQTGFLNVTGGGVVEAQANVEIASFASGNGTVVVSGNGSQLISGGYTSVGDQGASAVAMMTVANGGTVDTAGDAYFGRLAGATGTANINDGGTWNANAMYVGGNAGAQAGSGVLNVNAGGLVDITNTLRVYGNGAVNLQGGTIEANAINVDGVGGGVDFFFTSGTFRFAGSTSLTAAIFDDLFGTVHTVLANRELDVNGLATLNAPLRVHGGTLTVNDITNIGNLDFDAGTFNLQNANLVVGAAGLFGSVLTIEDDQTINVTQTATVDMDAELVVVGNFSSGGLTNNGSAVFIDTTGSGKTITGAVNNPAGAEITVVGDITFADGLSGAGDIFGPGTVISETLLDPGDSAAAVSIEGNLTLTDTNSLLIELGGLSAGSEYDQLLVGGDVALDGILDVSLINPFTPSAGNDFTLITGASISGAFDEVLGDPGSGLGYDVSYLPDSVVLSVVSLLVPGDADGDGDVDLDDYNIMSGNMYTNVAGGASDGDFDDDGDVDFEDFVIQALNFGDWPAAEESLDVVPEPGAGVVLLLTAAGVMLRRRR